ncbi:MAG: DUF3343 domain-containing protein [Chloroflexi bacterium]|nr:DUF3343 domain-containing protein [Chloroflexota bacterium]
MAKLVDGEEFGVVLVPSTSAALRAERVLQKAGLAVRLIPVPRELSNNCGIAARIAWGERESVTAALQAAGVEMDAIHHL